jgi:hypothetical protein
VILTRMLRELLHRQPAADAPPQIGSGPGAGNPLADYYFNNPGRRINKWHHYFEIYHRHFAAFRGRAPVVVEIGVWQGGSLQMWHDYFGPGARIVGIDVDPRCRQFEDASTSILIGDQADRGFLAEVRERVPHIDILIDDGGHTMTQQIVTFEELYPHIQPNGIYLCEDMHTSLLEKWGGGPGREGTFLEYSKALIDQLYGWYATHPGQVVGSLTRTTFALHFYNSVLVIEKRPLEPPQDSATGTSVLV